LPLLPRNPFHHAEELETVRRGFEEVHALTGTDADLFAEAERSARAAESQLESARRLSSQAATDAAPDSPEILQSRQGVEQLATALADVHAQLQTAHSDWQTLDAEADRIGQEAGRHAAVLQGQLREAEAALNLIASTASAVRAAAVWSGSYGVMICGQPGADWLGQARQALQRGDYSGCKRAAESGRRAAEQAIAEAEAQVRRLRRAEEERLERERRRRREAEEARRRAQSASSSWGGGGGGGSRRSSFSSGSGTSRSSFSRGSGTSRSGW
ncbi:MAG: hypothetical protein AB1813_07750, partial [Verrucomicrobiota bacterium]